MRKFTSLFLIALSLLLVVGLFACGKTPDVKPEVNVDEVRATTQAEVDELFAKLDRGAYNDEDLAIFDQIQAYANLFITNAKTGTF